MSKPPFLKDLFNLSLTYLDIEEYVKVRKLYNRKPTYKYYFKHVKFDKNIHTSSDLEHLKEIRYLRYLYKHQKFDASAGIMLKLLMSNNHKSVDYIRKTQGAKRDDSCIAYAFRVDNLNIFQYFHKCTAYAYKPSDEYYVYYASLHRADKIYEYLREFQ